MAGNAKAKCPQHGNLFVELRSQNRENPTQWDTLTHSCGVEVTGGDIDDASAPTTDNTTFDNLCAGSYSIVLTPAEEDATFAIAEQVGNEQPWQEVGKGQVTRPVMIENDKTSLHHFQFSPCELLVQVAGKGFGTAKGVPLKGVEVTVTSDGPLTGKKETTKDTDKYKGLADFGIAPCGNEFTLELKLTEEHKRNYVAKKSYGSVPGQRLEQKPFLAELELRQIFLQLLCKDPDGTVQPFPKDFPVVIKFSGVDPPEKDAVKVVDDKGNLSFTLCPGANKFTIDAADDVIRYFVYKKEVSKWVPDDKPCLENPSDADLRTLTIAGKRFFSLPKTWSLAVCVWEKAGLTVGEDGLSDIPAVGGCTNESPGKLTLLPKCQYVRLEFFDRKYCISDHNKKRISIPPVVLKGTREADATGAPVAPLAGTHDVISNWMIDESDVTKACQVLPWIITKKGDCTDLPKLNNKMLLEFGWEKGFVCSSSDTERKIEELEPDDAKRKPSKDRNQYYDLPKLWKSKCYYARFSDATKDKFFDELKDADDPDLEASFTKETKLLFSLDDIVLVNVASQAIKDKDSSNADKDLSKHSRIAVLELDPDDKYKVKVHEPRAKAPYWSESEFQKEAIADTCRNAIVKFTKDPINPRVVVFCSGFYDIFDKRTEAADFTKKEILGARAAKLDDPDVSAKKCFDQQADIDAGYVHRKRKFDLHYLHYCAIDGNKVYNALVTYWSAIVFSKAADKPAAWTRPNPLTEDIADTRNYREEGMGNAMSRWHEKDYQYENSADPSTIVIKPFCLFEAKGVEDPLGTFVSRGGSAHSMLAVGTGGSWASETEMYMRKVAYTDEAKPYGSGPGDPDDPLNAKADYDDSTTQRLTLAHELGHAAGLWDDYVTGKLDYPVLIDAKQYPWATAWSYAQRFPGMPYSIDNMALMKTNHAIRMRYFWGKAKWLNDSTKIGKDLYDLLKDEEFKITFSPAGKTALNFSLVKDKYNNIYKPAYNGANVGFGNDATSDLLLYKLGDGETARAISANQTYDGILVVRTKISIRFVTGTDGAWQWGQPGLEPYFWMQALEKDITKMLNGKDKYQEYGKFRCNGPVGNDFKNTYVMFAPHWEYKANEGDAASGGTHFTLIVKKDKDPLDVTKKSKVFATATNKITVGYDCHNKEIIRYFFGKDATHANLVKADFNKLSEWIGHADRANGAFSIEDL